MTQFAYYALIFITSFLLFLLYLFNWRKQFHVAFTALFIMLPILELTYLLIYYYHDPATTNALMKIIFMCVTFLPAMLTFCVLSLCMIPVSHLVRNLVILVSTAVMIPFLLLDLILPGSITIREIGGNWVMLKDYGVFQTVYNIFLLTFLSIDLAIVFYTYFKQKQVSRIILFLLVLPIIICMVAYVVGMASWIPGYEVMPLAFVLSQWIYLWIVDQMAYHSVSEIVTESIVEGGDVGFITVDSRGRYLGSNEIARKILPDLENMAVDQFIGENEAMRKTVFEWIRRFRADSGAKKITYKAEISANEKDVQQAIREVNKEEGKTEKKKTDKEDREETGKEERDIRYYSINVGDLYYGGKRCGYQVFMEDDTQNQKYIRLIGDYNKNLKADVKAKTERIVSMHEQLIMGMATMVESRDNSTGGHIRRTSEGVKLLTEAIKRDGSLHLSEGFCDRLIKAAPMHDLGKIAVDDVILRKPGRYTPEEFNVMKSHAAEGARIVHEILKDSDDEEFRRIAENVAHYHHERMDGSGYPDGLKGEEIPLEARIMAIADVYDALVSKRVYKDSFSFEKADRIILEGMGTQFDEGLRKYYEAARPALESYYSSIGVGEKAAAGMG
ncbi:MAG: HD domain-containing protein [Lachnospiraceae bacterium]|nr:HD domain-containing protein [Lachnospiraceae bacterium]